MREILFRGKRSDTGEWIYGDLRQDKDLETAYIGGWDYFTADYALQREPFEYPVSPETVGQFTGLTDKNGNRIFEGDIIEAHFDELFPDLATTLIVVWSDYGWFGRDMEGNVDSLECKWVSDFFEIIGNIHDNPELLEVSGNNG